MSDQRQNNLISLQLLRGIAAASVVYFHIVFHSQSIYPTFGKFGVDIFFVISGFVMALIISNKQSPRYFAISRIARIVPLYWTLSFLVFLIAVIKPSLLGSTNANINDLLLSLFFIPHFRDFGTLHPILVVGWSLNYEMFFYSVILISILVERKHYIFILCGLITLTYIFLGHWFDSLLLNSFFGKTYLFEFLLGILSFKLYKLGIFSKINKVVLTMCAITLYLIMAYFEINHFDFDRIFLYGIPSTLLLLSVTALERSNEENNNLMSNFILSVGDSSYATYLSHFYVVAGFQRIIFPKLGMQNLSSSILGVLLILVSSLVVGRILYTFVDKPLSQHLKGYLLKKF